MWSYKYTALIWSGIKIRMVWVSFSKIIFDGEIKFLTPHTLWSCLHSFWVKWDEVNFLNSRWNNWGVNEKYIFRFSIPAEVPMNDSLYFTREKMWKVISFCKPIVPILWQFTKSSTQTFKNGTHSPHFHSALLQILSYCHFHNENWYSG